MYKPFANFLWIPSDQISSRPHTTDFPQNVAFWKGNPLISGKSRLVKYSIWPDSFSWHSKGRVWDGFPPPSQNKEMLNGFQNSTVSNWHGIPGELSDHLFKTFTHLFEATLEDVLLFFQKFTFPYILPKTNMG